MYACVVENSKRKMRVERELVLTSFIKHVPGRRSTGPWTRGIKFKHVLSPVLYLSTSGLPYNNGDISPPLKLFCIALTFATYNLALTQASVGNS